MSRNTAPLSSSSMGELDSNVVAYCNHLSAVLLATQATDRSGDALGLKDAAQRVVELILTARAAASKIMLIGNGGSAVIAGHMQMDLCNAVGVRAMIFNDPAVLTALSNDHGYEVAFERSVALWGRSGDLMLAISSSGRSPNILGAVRAAEKHGCKIVTMSGFAPRNPLRALGDVNFFVPSDVYGFVELAHAALTHFLTDSAKARLSSGKC